MPAQCARGDTMLCENASAGRGGHGVGGGWSALYTAHVAAVYPVPAEELDQRACHYTITRCAPYDFLSEIGMRELATLFCEGDEVFYLQAFPEIDFSRGDSWQHTSARGHHCCEYVFRLRQPGAAATESRPSLVA